LQKKDFLQTDFVTFHHSVSTIPSKKVDLHCHPYYEIYFFINGDVSYLVEGNDYQPSPCSILLMAPNVFHGVKVNTPHRYERFALHFLPGLLSEECREILLSPFHCANIYYRQTDSFHIQHYFDAILECKSMDSEIKNIAIKSRIEALLTQIYNMNRSGYSMYASDAEHSYSVQELISYLNEHIREPLSLDLLVNRFFISKNQLNRVFRQATGTTVGNYVSHKRVTLAQQLILQGQSTIEASMNAGFRDYSTFYRSFKKIFGHSPAEAKNHTIL
jgi:AraC-like DNA-binding protein